MSNPDILRAGQTPGGSSTPAQYDALNKAVISLINRIEEQSSFLQSLNRNQANVMTTAKGIEQAVETLFMFNKALTNVIATLTGNSIEHIDELIQQQVQAIWQQHSPTNKPEAS